MEVKKLIMLCFFKPKTSEREHFTQMCKFIKANIKSLNNLNQVDAQTLDVLNKDGSNEDLFRRYKFVQSVK